jgi:hypothetical protein
MRAEPDKLEARVVRLAVDQDEIGTDVAIAVIAPLAAKRMIEIGRRNGSSLTSMVTVSSSSASRRLPCRPDFSRL